MTDTNKSPGFYGTEVETYYVTPSGRAWCWGSGDFDGVRELPIGDIPADATSADEFMSPDEAASILGEIEAESGESLIEEA